MPRKKKEAVSVSLFSFLDILSGVIGVFTLIIVGMTIISLETTQQILELSAGSEMLHAPSHIECQEKGIILHPEGYKIPTANVRSDLALKNRLDWLEKRSDKHYPLFLLRSQGYANFETVRSMVAARELKYGFEAIFDAGDVIFKTPDGIQLEPTGNPVFRKNNLSGTGDEETFLESTAS